MKCLDRLHARAAHGRQWLAKWHSRIVSSGESSYLPTTCRKHPAVSSQSALRRLTAALRCVYQSEGEKHVMCLWQVIGLDLLSRSTEQKTNGNLYCTICKRLQDPFSAKGYSPGMRLLWSVVASPGGGYCVYKQQIAAPWPRGL